MTKYITTDMKTGIPVIDQEVVNSICDNNTFIPNVKNVIFNLKVEEKVAVRDAEGKIVAEPALDATGNQRKDRDGNLVVKNKVEFKKLKKPVLTTIVKFEDGTKVIVKNSLHDPVEVKETKVGDKTIYVASESSKEKAICYAIMKRLTGQQLVDEETGELTDEIGGSGLAKTLASLISDAYDQPLEIAKTKLAKSEAKAKHEAQKKNAKAKSKRYSIGEIVQILGPVAEALATKVTEDPSVLDKFKKMITG